MYRTLHQGILSGQYSAGYRLVLDRIARELGVSAVPVREAIRRLEAEGLVKFQCNVGAVVTGVDKKDYAVTTETMAVMEGYATALSIPYLTEEDLKEAHELNDQMRELLVGEFDPPKFTTLSIRFHRILTQRCPNHRLFDLLERECDRVTIIRRTAFAFDPSYSTQSVDEHEEILKLIEEGSPSVDVELAAREHRMWTMYKHTDTDHKPAY
ncbi:GntR family transcriptional regulator [Actinomyces urinae]|uniref:GntR family transcriptional regulator n=1 Tax=Actinomyces urinae TaxID=1689268 RepID=UPI001E4D4C40|nr:GntR family transcriptional regulator [Actinomyces urinae]